MIDSNYKIPIGLSNFLNLIRWIAALLVVMTHIRTLLFVNLEQLDKKNIYLDIFYFLTSLGGEAVIVFFVLSGYLVGGKVYQDFILNKFEWKNYLIKRLSRLYVVLIPALLIGGLLDYLGILYFNDTFIYNNALHLTPFNYNISERLNIMNFLSNLFMLQTTFTPQFGSNGPLWSLANEFWYYLIFPLLLKMKFSRHLLTKVFSLFLLLLLILVLNIDILLYFAIWAVGVLAYLYNGKIIKFPFALIILILCIYIDTIHILPYSKLNALTIALGVGLLLTSLKYNYKFKNFIKLNEVLADSSYSLYLFHAPFLLFLVSSYSIPISQQVSEEGLFLFGFILIIIYIYSFCMYFLFEKNTYKIKNYLVGISKWK